MNGSREERGQSTKGKKKRGGVGDEEGKGSREKCGGGLRVKEKEGQSTRWRHAKDLTEVFVQKTEEGAALPPPSPAARYNLYQPSLSPYWSFRCPTSLLRASRDHSTFPTTRNKTGSTHHLGVRRERVRGKRREEKREKGRKGG